LRKVIVGILVFTALLVGRRFINQGPDRVAGSAEIGMVRLESPVDETERMRRSAWQAALAFDSYLAVMVQGSGRLARWPERVRDPLRIFVPSSRAVGYTPEHRRAVLDAFGRWSRVGPGVIPVVFDFVRDSATADVVIEWVATLPDGKAGLATMKSTGEGWIQGARLSLALGSPSGWMFRPEATYTIALHEIGHLLGLGHSDDRRDVMYPTTGIQDLTLRDRTTARLLYQIAPGPVGVWRGEGAG